MTPYCAVQRMRDEAVAARDPAAPAVPRSAASCQHPAYAEPLIKLPLAAAADLLPTKTPLRGRTRLVRPWPARCRTQKRRPDRLRNSARSGLIGCGGRV